MKVLRLRKIKEVNSGTLHFFKVSSIKTLVKMLNSIAAAYTKNDFKDLTPSILEMIFHGKKHFKYETKLPDSTGKFHTVVVRLSTNTIDYSMTFAVIEDISEIKKVQAELEERVRIRTHDLEKANQELRAEIASREQIANDLHKNEARIRQLNSIYPVGIFHTDTEGNCIYSNPKAQELQGLLMENADHHPTWFDNIHPNDKEHVVTVWENALKHHTSTNIDYRFIHEEKITWVNGQTVPEYDQYGNVIGHVGILSDITKQREAEEQIKENQIEIAHFSRLNSMGEVASGIAHELNQPLTAIINYTSGCKRLLEQLNIKIPDKIVNAIDQSIAQASRAGKIIHHLKDFLSKGALNKQTFDLNASIKDILVFIHKTIEQAKVNIKLKLDKSSPTIYAGKIHIEQVILNIINNAIDAIVEANSEKRQITIRTKLLAYNQVRISISDTGPGIADEVIDKLFNPFITTKDNGMGIGLALCDNIIDKHNGKMRFTTRKNKGAIFQIILPLN